MTDPITKENLVELSEKFEDWFDTTFPDYKVHYPLNKQMAKGMARAAFARGTVEGFHLPHSLIEEPDGETQR